MKDRLSKNELSEFISNIEDHIFSLNRFAADVEKNEFEIRKEVEMIYNYSQDFLYDEYGIKIETNWF